jgi:hypothetical protein
MAETIRSVSHCRQQAECDGLEAGGTYRQVVTNPFGRPEEEILVVEQFDDCEQLSIRCLDTGTFVRFALTEARGGTFVDGEAGMEPARIPDRIWDTVAGKRFYRDWLAKSLDALGAIAKRDAPSQSAGPRA